MLPLDRHDLSLWKNHEDKGKRYNLHKTEQPISPSYEIVYDTKILQIPDITHQVRSLVAECHSYKREIPTNIIKPTFFYTGMSTKVRKIDTHKP